MTTYLLICNSEGDLSKERSHSRDSIELLHTKPAKQSRDANADDDVEVDADEDQKETTKLDETRDTINVRQSSTCGIL